MFYQEVFDWILLIVRWVHITVAVTWIGTSIFFMWLDRSFVKNASVDREGHVGDLWMVHGGGFYKVEKMLMGPTKVPEHLHWFKWESYWTWMSGMLLLVLTYYTGGGTYLLDPSVASLSFTEGLGIALFSIFGSWIIYDFLWENSLTRAIPALGHFLTAAWFVFVTVFLCKTLAGRAAYIHVGAMLGTWMAGNVFMRIIPRQLKMVEASKEGKPVNQEWAKNAKNRSTHNTYFTLPVIFIMLSNHFPATYGSEWNWVCLILITLAGGLIRQYFVIRLARPNQAKICAYFGIVFLILAAVVTNQADPFASIKKTTPPPVKDLAVKITPTPKAHNHSSSQIAKQVKGSVKGEIVFEGAVPEGKTLRLPSGCAQAGQSPVKSDEVKVQSGKLQNVLVRVVSGPIEKGNFEGRETKAILDQKGCLYHPRVLAVRVGQVIAFKNSDPLFHNVKTKSKKNGGFNLLMPKKDQVIERSFERPELFVYSSCSVHPWMKAYIAVFDHPYFSVSNASGKFEIRNLPLGKYTLEFWHETLGEKTLEVELTEQLADQVHKIKFSAKKG